MSMIYFDNTRISSYRGCPRQFFFRHNRDWIRDYRSEDGEDGGSIDLIFGSSWHEAMNAVWKFGSDKSITNQNLLALSVQAFNKCWVESGLLEPTQANFLVITERKDKKTPWVAMEMLENYIKERRSFISQCTSIEIERPFAIPLGIRLIIDGVEREVMYIGRLDKIVQHPAQGRLIIEHKTTGWYAKEGGFRRDYIESFSPNSQVDGYIFAGNSLYDGGIKGVWVDAALCHKTVHDKFKFIPCDRQFAMMDDWLNDTQEWVSRIQLDIEKHDQHLPSFPKNTSSCNIFSGCSYRDICKFVAAPLAVAEPPPGYRVEKWEPFDVLKIGKILEKIGD